MDVKDIVEREIAYERASLAGQCRALADHLTNLATVLEPEGDLPYDHLLINDLGEVQSRGTMIDACCGRLMGKISVLRLMIQKQPPKG